MTVKTKAPKAQYVDNKKFHAEMDVYIRECRRKEAVGEPSPRVPPYIAECIMKIATHLSYRKNFINYPFREEMVADGIENSLRYIENYDPDKYQNPFAYFTKTIYYAFLRRIEKEKSHLYTKHVATQLAELHGQTSDRQEGEDRTSNSNLHGEWAHEKMLHFMDDFETNRRKRKRKKRVITENE
jgi:hypothetical protein